MAAAQAGSLEQAAELYRAVLATDNDNPPALSNLSIVLKDLKQLPEALACAERAIAVLPTFAAAWCNRGLVFDQLRRFDEAIASYEHAHALMPNMPYALGSAIFCRMQLCRWDGSFVTGWPSARTIAVGQALARPLTILATPAAPALLQTLCGGLWQGNFMPEQPHQSHATRRRCAIKSGSVIFPAIFTTTRLVFWWPIFSSGMTGPALNWSVSAAAPLLTMPRATVCVRPSTNLSRYLAGTSDEVARLVRELGIDIAIDLAGHTENSGLGILAHRPAPVQVHYLGYAGTLGLPFIDYLVGDPVVIPPEQRRYYYGKGHLPARQLHDRR